jgi:hypothetical protein
MFYSYNTGIVAIIAELIGLLELQLEMHIISFIPLMLQQYFTYVTLYSAILEYAVLVNVKIKAVPLLN